MESFRLINIKSFEDTGDIELKPITVFVGRNSSGKSSLVRFPVVLAQTFMEETISPIVFNGKQVDYGNFEDVVHEHEGDELGFEVSINFEDLLKNRAKSFFALTFLSSDSSLKKFQRVTLKVTLKVSENKSIALKELFIFHKKELFFEILATSNFTYSIKTYGLFEDKKFTLKDEPITYATVYSGLDEFIPNFDLFFATNKKSFNRMVLSILEKQTILNEGEKAEISNFISNYYFRQADLQIDSKNQNILYANKLLNTLSFLHEIMAVFSDYFNFYHKDLFYIGPFRNNPERTYRNTENIKNNVGKNGENTSMLLRQTKNNENPSFQKVNKWFQSAMGYHINVEDIADSNYFRIKVAKDKHSKGDNLIDVGYGISQILPIVTQLYYKNHHNGNGNRQNQAAMYVIEQPEIHLHPNAQAELGNLFVEKISDKKTKILVETHSEHFIRRLQSLVANPENDFNVEDVAIYYIDMPVSGKSTVKKMEMNEMGQFKTPWPSGFFDKAYLLSKELIQNASKRAAQI